ncbi:MAG: ABC transporter permease [Pseudomonadota bacterium]|nr:ABC transporter permease [Pseudomonadota bacterium]
MGALAQSSGLLDSLRERWEDIVFLGREHILLVAVSGGLAILVGVPLGVALSRPGLRRVAEGMMQLLNVGTTIPTLAVLALSMSLLGIGKLPAIFALFIASLLPIVRNTYAGLRAVPPPLLEAAQGMGMTPGQRLWRVELPNALVVIFAGIRTALALNVGTAPLAFLIGGGGLGELIFTGLSMAEPGLMLAGAIPTALLAVVADFLVAQLAWLLIPRGINPAR